MSNFLKQPLLHFLLLGALLFAWNDRTAQPDSIGVESSDQELIVVDRTALLEYLQYQAQTFDSVTFNQRLDVMTADDRQRLIDAYVREEALYREALRMQLNNGDYIIKQRLVQKVEFLLENLAGNTPDPDELTLADFYAAHQQDYRVDAVYSFAHIFFDAGKDGPDGARGRAEALLARASTIGFEDAGNNGDRFPFLQSYVERTSEFVGNNFSSDFVSALDSLNPSQNWQGPVLSRYGYHLVMLTNRIEPRIQSLDEVRERVIDDYRYDRVLRSREAAEQNVIAGYRVRVELEPAP
jgi:peptidyl-prolyl cis-trans isomerase C